MDYSTPIQHAIQLVQKSPWVHYLGDLNRRSTRNERIFLGVASALTAYNLISYLKERRQRLRAPPSVAFGLPLVGHAPYLLFMPNKFIDWCTRKYGEVYNVRNFGKVITVVSGDSARDVLKANSEDLSMEEGSVKGIIYIYFLKR